MAEKQCPTCGQGWVEVFRFCPEDGTALINAPVLTSSQEAIRAANAPTVMYMTAAALAAAPTTEAPALAAEAPETPAKPKKAFSETSWFMQAIEPAMIDPETGRVVVDTAQPPAEEFDAEARKRYSLRTDEDEE